MRALVIGTLGIVLMTTGASAWAQGNRGAPARQNRMAADEVARLFEAYAIVQAQETLGLDETQFDRFLPRFRVLLQARRTYQVGRARLLLELGRLSRPDAPAADDAELRDKLRALDEEEARGRTEMAKAEAGVDETLTLVQRARFRLFEEQMERKKFELMTRARQTVRPPQRRLPQQP